MTNTRLTYDDAWIDKDMIQQILIMKDKIATGTYKNVNVAVGTGADANKLIFTFTDQDDTVHNFKIPYSYVSDMDISEGTGADKGKLVFSIQYNGTTTEEFKPTYKYLTGVTSSLDAVDKVYFTFTYNDGTSVDSAHLDVGSGLAHLGRAETFTGDKMFTGNVTMYGDNAIAITGPNGLAVTNGITAGGNISVTGNGSIGGDMTVTGDISSSGDLTVDGQAQIGSNLAIEDDSLDAVLSATGALKVSQSGGTAYAVVDAGTNQTVGGTKTFSENVISKKALIAHNDIDIRAAAPGAAVTYLFGAQDSENNFVGYLQTQHLTDNKMVTNVNASAYNRVTQLQLVADPTNNISYATVQGRPYTDAGGNDILVKGHIPDIPCVHLTGNESIYGRKTYMQDPYINGVNPGISLQNTLLTGSENPAGEAKYPICFMTGDNSKIMGQITGGVNTDGTPYLIEDIYNADRTHSSRLRFGIDLNGEVTLKISKTINGVTTSTTVATL